MTQQEWQNGNQFDQLFNFVQSQVSDRKRRLIACACYRAFGDYLPAGPSHRALETMERFADGLATAKELESATILAWPKGWEPLRGLLFQIGTNPNSLPFASFTGELLRRARRFGYGSYYDEGAGFWSINRQHCTLLRHMVNPFRSRSGGKRIHGQGRSGACIARCAPRGR
jgi:hypothetical protein